MIVRLAVLACAACGGSGSSGSPSAQGSICDQELSCAYQYQDVTECNELTPNYSAGLWLDNCVDNTACDSLSFSPSPFPSDPASPVPCSTTRSYRHVQTYVGSCQGTHERASVSAPSDTGLKGQGAICNWDNECAANNCVSKDGMTYICAETCGADGCASYFDCVGGYCFPACRPEP